MKEHISYTNEIILFVYVFVNSKIKIHSSSQIPEELCISYLYGKYDYAIQIHLFAKHNNLHYCTE